MSGATYFQKHVNRGGTPTCCSSQKKSIRSQTRRLLGGSAAPGEDAAAFKKLHDALIAELSPAGALEEDIVSSIARLVWRKRHLATFRVVPMRDRRRTITEMVDPTISLDKARKRYYEVMKPSPNPLPEEEIVARDHVARDAGAYVSPTLRKCTMQP